MALFPDDILPRKVQSLDDGGIGKSGPKGIRPSVSFPNSLLGPRVELDKCEQFLLRGS